MFAAGEGPGFLGPKPVFSGSYPQPCGARGALQLVPDAAGQVTSQPDWPLPQGAAAHPASTWRAGWSSPEMLLR